MEPAPEPSVIAGLPAGSLAYRVSSVLRRNAREFGAAHLFDGSDDTCWSSDQGSPQFVELVLPRAVPVTALVLMFQGGFAGQAGELLGGRRAEALDGAMSWEPLCAIEPEDVSSVQRFPIPRDAGGQPVAVDALRVVFNRSSDFYGRVTLYRLDVLGPVDAGGATA